MDNIKEYKVKIFADGADKDGILDMNKRPYIKGFTTNPTLMKQAGILDYKNFSIDILSLINDKPFSIEVFSDDFQEMKKQAYEIASWGDNVYVKIPITNTKGESCEEIVKELSNSGVKLNITAIFTLDQVNKIIPCLAKSPGSYISVFAGRIADAGLDPLPIMKEVVSLIENKHNIELIWASPRELFNLVQANEIGCDIITATNSIINKIPNIGKDLNLFSLETVQMFYDDAQSSGYNL